MIPNKVKIKTLTEVDGKVEEVEKEYFFQFNFNAINAFRKSENISFEEFETAFEGIENGDFDSFERVGKLFLCALQEGARKMKTDFDLSIEDILDWMNDDQENFNSVMIGYQGDSSTEESKKKLSQERA